jgi:hypothetical protein
MGGEANSAAADYSFTAGLRAKVRPGDKGSFVWADSTNADFSSTGSNEFDVRAGGGVHVQGAATVNGQTTLDNGSNVAVKATANAQQDRSSGGWMKALVREGAGQLSRCFNSQAADAASVATCTGFSITGSNGDFTVTFPFTVNDRFVSVTAESNDGPPTAPACCLVQYNFPTPSSVRVRTWDANGAVINRAWSMVVF